MLTHSLYLYPFLIVSTRIYTILAMKFVVIVVVVVVVMMMEMAVVSADCLDAVERNVRPFMCEKQINIIIIEVELS